MFKGCFPRLNNLVDLIYLVVQLPACKAATAANPRMWCKTILSGREYLLSCRHFDQLGGLDHVTDTKRRNAFSFPQKQASAALGFPANAEKKSIETLKESPRAIRPRRATVCCS
jgi:hypothetical protein